MNINTRLLDENKATDYRELRLKSYKESPLAFSESFEDEQHKALSEFERELMIQGTPPEWFVLGAFSTTEKLIGFVKFRRDLRSKAHHKSMIHAMYTDPKYRNHGIGKKLILDLLERVRTSIGLEQIHLWVLHSDTSAIDFYIKYGFERQGFVVKKDLKVGGTYLDSEYMVMYLNDKQTATTNK